MRSLLTLGVVVALLAAGQRGSLAGARQATAVGTGRIHGQLLAADTGVPVAQAQVTAQGVGRVHSATSDDQGRFEIVGVTAGRFTVVASKPGYAPTFYGQLRPGMPARTLELEAGTVVQQIDIRLLRSGVIIVRVTDDAGQPLPGVNVQALAVRPVDGEGRMIALSADRQTDDRGEYRLAGLTPDDYYVRASVSQQALMQGVRPSGEGRMYMPTYYPGTLLAADARALSVGPGQEVPATIALVAQRAAKITGRVLTTPEGLASLAVSLRPREGAPSGLRMRIEGDGRFEARDVVPGEYILSAQSRVAGTQEFAARLLTVESNDIPDIALTLLPGGTVSGRVVFEGNAPAAPVARGSAFATLVSAPGSLNISPGRSVWNNDWTFQIKDVVGTYLIRSVRGPDWYLKGVFLRDDDITDTPLEIADGRRVDGVTVVLTQKYTEVTGSALDRTRKPVNDFTAVVFPVESYRWTPRSRFVVAARAGRDGKVSIRGLPPGRYLAAAVDGLLPDAVNDPRFLEGLQNDAVSFTLDEAGRQNVTMTLIPGTGMERVPMLR